MDRNKSFQKLFLFVIIGMAGLVALFVFAAGLFTIENFRIAFQAAGLLFLIVVVFLVTGFLKIKRMISYHRALATHEGGQQSVKPSAMAQLALRFFMPFLLLVSELFNYNKDEIRRVYIQANNEVLLSSGIKVSPEKMLIILPHCIQNSKCGIRLKDGISDCKKCQACNIGDISEMIGRWGVRSHIATGGTAARKIIKDMKPDFVIAVACERDLSSGLMDVTSLPVYGILNERPNGPCIDTCVDLYDLKQRINFFLNEPNE